MNDLIKELADQAVSFRLDPDSECYEAMIHPEDLERFAALIIEECVDYAFANGDNVDYLKQYFGVE